MGPFGLPNRIQKYERHFRKPKKDRFGHGETHGILKLGVGSVGGVGCRTLLIVLPWRFSGTAPVILQGLSIHAHALHLCKN